MQPQQPRPCTQQHPRSRWGLSPPVGLRAAPCWSSAPCWWHLERARASPRSAAGGSPKPAALLHLPKGLSVEVSPRSSPKKAPGRRGFIMITDTEDLVGDQTASHLAFKGHRGGAKSRGCLSQHASSSPRPSEAPPLSCVLQGTLPAPAGPASKSQN